MTIKSAIGKTLTPFSLCRRHCLKASSPPAPDKTFKLAVEYLRWWARCSINQYWRELERTDTLAGNAARI